MTIVSHNHPFVVGVDTHARKHVVAVLAASGEHLGTRSFPTTARGLGRALDFVGRLCGGDLDTLWVVEGAASYGAVLAGIIQEGGYQVVEAPRVPAAMRHGVGKSDALDAHAIATVALATQVHLLRHPRHREGLREAMSILVGARESMTRERTATHNALTAMVRTHDLGIDARKAPTLTQVRTIAAWRTRSEDIATSTARREAKRLACRLLDLDTDITANHRDLQALVAASPAAPLTEVSGIGVLTAATAYVAYSHPGRFRSEAAFANLAGVAPIPASSGNTTRHRLNRGGDRRLNRVLHIAVLVRMTHDPETRDYVNKRTAQGLTTREIRRILKRYLARRIYRTLEANHPHPTTHQTAA